jgi:hypothetical protein
MRRFALAALLLSTALAASRSRSRSSSRGVAPQPTKQQEQEEYTDVNHPCAWEMLSEGDFCFKESFYVSALRAYLLCFADAMRVPSCYFQTLTEGSAAEAKLKNDEAQLDWARNMEARTFSTLRAWVAVTSATLLISFFTLDCCYCSPKKCNAECKLL